MPVDTDYKFHWITDLCFRYEILYKADRNSIQHDQLIKAIASRYDNDTMVEIAKYVLQVVLEKKPVYPWGYFKKVLLQNHERIAREYKESLTKKDQQLKIDTEVGTIIENKCQVFATCLMAEWFLCEVNNGGKYKLPKMSDDDYEVYKRCKEQPDSVAEAEYRNWETRMRQLGYGKYYDKLYGHKHYSE